MEGRELSWRERGRLWLRLVVRLLLAAAVILLVVYAGPPLLSLFMPFVLVFGVAWMLNPLVRTLQKKLGISRKFWSLLVILLILGGVSGIVAVFIWNIATELMSLANNYQVLILQFQEAGEALSAFLSNTFGLVPEEVLAFGEQLLTQLTAWLQEWLPALLSAAGVGAAVLVRETPSFLVAAVVFLMGSYFISADYPAIRYRISRIFPTGSRQFLGEVKEAASSAFGGYVRAQFFLSVVVFFILLVGFVIIGQPYNLLLAFLLAVMDFIPIIGAGTVMVPWAVIDLLTGEVRHAVELLVIWGIIALFRRVAEPKFVGDQTGLSPILSLISIYVGMRLAGVLGMILGPVACMVLLSVVRLGIFRPTAEDLRLAATDLAAFLRHRPEQEKEAKK